MEKKFIIAVFASGNGSNAEEIFKFFKDHPVAEVGLLLTNNPTAYVLERAKKYGIATRIFNRLELTESNLIMEWLREKEVTHLVLAGFLWLIPVYLIEAFPNRIINIHPALLPKYGGKGMYGMKVHEAVRFSGDRETGITIHLVNTQYDEGKVLFQGKCEIDENCSPEEIAKRVHALEYSHYPKVIEEWISTSG